MQIEILTVVLGFALGFIGFVAEDVLRRWLDRQSVRKKALKNLVSEAGENKKIQEVSTWIPLQKDAWYEAKNSGVVMDLKEDLRKKLVSLYSRIIEKNELLVYHKIGVEINKQLSVQGGAVGVPLNQIIGELTSNLKEEIDSIIPLLEKALDC
jgi:thioredoxin-like negative regulator of GroEL